MLEGGREVKRLEKKIKKKIGKNSIFGPNTSPKEYRLTNGYKQRVFH